MDTANCPYCAEIIKVDAVKCRYCGEFLDEDLRLQRLEESSRVTYQFNPGLAAVLSIVGTGFGQIYQMRIPAALMFMAAMGFFLFLGTLKPTFFLAAVVIHLTNIWEAYLWRPDASELVREEADTSIPAQVVQPE